MPKINFLKNIFILDAARTAIGGTFKSLKNFTAPQLAAFAIQKIVRRNNIKENLINEVILGNTVSAGTGQNLSRQAAMFAGLPVTVPAFTVNSVCGSGLQAVILAAQSIACRKPQVIIAGGTESSSHSPKLIKNYEETKEPLDSLIHDGLWCHLSHKHMGDLAEIIAEKFEISRPEQDRFAFESHKKSCRAQEENKFIKEIVPVAVAGNRVFAKDERPRKNINLENLASLPAAFKTSGGTVTAGNSSIPSDGAAVVLLASEEAVKENKLKPKARILGYASIAVEPQMVFTAAVPAVKKCLQDSALAIKDIDLFEISEAFACQAIYTKEELSIHDYKMNIWGGDVALGHPLGAAGARALTTLIHALDDQKKKKGVVSVCLGGGGAVALAVELVK